VAANEFARFMWIWVQGVAPLSTGIYIAFCYLPPTFSSYAIRNGLDGDPFIDLYTSITQYSMVGEVILVGDFNSCTKALQIPLHDQLEDVFCI
jgi:hypothetical protein